MVTKLVIGTCFVCHLRSLSCSTVDFHYVSVSLSQHFPNPVKICNTDACCRLRRSGRHGNSSFISTRGAKMVKLHIKRADETQFLVETTVEVSLSQLIPQLIRLYNGRLKVDRLCQGWCVGGSEGSIN